MFHSTDFTSKTAITTPTKTLRGEVVPQGSGSGFVWDDQGHVAARAALPSRFPAGAGPAERLASAQVVTNYHVIQQAQKATVTGLGTGDEASMASYDATLVGAEPEKDIAVLKVRAPASVQSAGRGVGCSR